MKAIREVIGEWGPAEWGCILLTVVVLAFLLLFPMGAKAAYREPPPLIVVGSTSYCLQGRMADGTWTRPRSAASNYHPLGTRIRLRTRPGPGGYRLYVIRDRIGHGSELDLWTPSCSTARAYGRHGVGYTIGWRR